MFHEWNKQKKFDNNKKKPTKKQTTNDGCQPKPTGTEQTENGWHPLHLHVKPLKKKIKKRNK